MQPQMNIACVEKILLKESQTCRLKKQKLMNVEKKLEILISLEYKKYDILINDMMTSESLPSFLPQKIKFPPASKILKICIVSFLPHILKNFYDQKIIDFITVFIIEVGFHFYFKDVNEAATLVNKVGAKFFFYL